MGNYAKPTLRINPGQIILNIGTNDLPIKKKSDKIAKEIMELATSVKNHACEVSISNLTARNDYHCRKAIAVNNELKELYKEENINLIDHGKTIMPSGTLMDRSFI